jgi:hypothetical protein
VKSAFVRLFIIEDADMTAHEFESSEATDGAFGDGTTPGNPPESYAPWREKMFIACGNPRRVA